VLVLGVKEELGGATTSMYNFLVVEVSDLRRTEVGSNKEVTSSFVGSIQLKRC
jgi:hypothetical protein